MNRIKRLSLFSLFALLSVFFIGINTIKAADVLSIENVEITDKSSGTEAIVSIDSGEITNSVTFHSLNEYVTYKITVKNNSGKKIVIKTITDDNSDNQIEYQYDKHETEEIDSNGELDLAVKAVYKNENTDMTNRSLNSKVTLVISYYDEGELKSSSITINPKTNDNIHLFISLLIVSFIGLTICSLIKSNSKIKKYLVIIGIIVTVPIMAKAASIACSIVFNAGITFEDKVLLTYVIDGQENTIVVPYDSLIEDIEFPCEEGYAPDDWKNEDNSDYDTSKRIKDDIKLYATLKYVAKPTITVTNFDSFSYTAPNAAAYYISTSSAFPSDGSISSDFALDTWTTSLNTGDLDLIQKNTYYIFVKDSNNEISINNATQLTRQFSFVGTKFACSETNSVPEYIPNIIIIDVDNLDTVSCKTYNQEYVLDGTNMLLNSKISSGHENLMVKKNNEDITDNTSVIIDEDVVIRTTSTPKENTLTFNPNGGVFEGSSDPTVKVMQYGSKNNSGPLKATREGYIFEGWFTSDGLKIYASDGYANSCMGLSPQGFWNSTTICIDPDIPNPGSKAEWIHLQDEVVYAHWSLDKPSIIRIDYNSFSYNVPKATKYYVSTNSNVPTINDAIDTFALDTWTTATETDDLELDNITALYVWAADSDGNISPSNSIKVYKLTSNVRAEFRENDRNGELIGSSGKVYVLSNTKVNYFVDLGENITINSINMSYNVGSGYFNATIENGSSSTIYSDTTYDVDYTIYIPIDSEP